MLKDAIINFRRRDNEGATGTKMTTILGCIADDFTGASDLAGLLGRSGYKVKLRIGIPNTQPENTAAFEVIALKSRTSPVDQAVGEARAALRWLKEAGATRFFWKYCSTFDSTDKGNIGPVAEALMADLNIDQTIYCPAFPENGRSIFMGNLFVEELPLAESPMKDHPLTPMRDSNLMRLLAPQTILPIGLANRHCVARGCESLRNRLNKLKEDGVAHVVIDAVTNDDLHTIAETCRNMPLLTGGSAVAMPLPALYSGDGLLSEDAETSSIPPLEKGMIVLSGSCSSMTREQVADFSSKADCFQLSPLDLADSGLQQAREWLATRPMTSIPMIYATAEPDAVRLAQEKLGVKTAGELVENALAQLAIDARNNGRHRFVVAGGETSGAVVKALEVTELTIGEEIAPGVPWTFTRSNGQAIALTLKSGNFGAKSFFSDAFSKLES